MRVPGHPCETWVRVPEAFLKTDRRKVIFPSRVVIVLGRTSMLWHGLIIVIKHRLTGATATCFREQFSKQVGSVAYCIAENGLLPGLQIEISALAGFS
jgi:hypothetical protein